MKTTYVLQEENSDNIFIGRCTTKTLKNRVSQIRMGNIRQLHIVAHGDLTDSEHTMLLREVQPFSAVRGWYRISKKTHSVLRELLTQLDKFNDVNSVSDRLLRLVRPLQGTSYSSVLVDMTDNLNLTRDMVIHLSNVLVRQNMLSTNPHVEVL